jgi:hypothetical protein
MQQPQRGGQRANRDSLGPEPRPAPVPGDPSSGLKSILDHHLSSLPPPAVFNQLDALAGWWFRCYRHPDLISVARNELRGIQCKLSGYTTLDAADSV